MRLLIAADIFPPQSGGPATYVVTIAMELKRQGWHITIISLNPHADTAAVACTVLAVGSANKFFRYIEYLYFLFIHSGKVDAIYAMGPVNAGLPALLVSWLRRKKMVVKVVGDYAWEQGVQRFGVADGVDAFQKKTYGWKVQFLKWVEKIVVQRADGVLTPSEYLKSMVVGWDVEEKKVQVIYNAVEYTQVPLVEKNSEERWLVTVGRLVPWKGMKELVACMPVLLKKDPRCRLLIVGDGPEMSHLQSVVRTLALEGVVRLMGNLSPTSTLSYIHAADIFILNSGYEGLAHTLLEALRYERRVLASAVGGNREVVIPGKTGDLFDYNNQEQILEKILGVLAEENRINNFVATEEGKEFLNRFSLSTMIRQTMLFFQNICGS